jgi:hypothetical protein
LVARGGLKGMKYARAETTATTITCIVGGAPALTGTARMVCETGHRPSRPPEANMITE